MLKNEALIRAHDLRIGYDHQAVGKNLSFSLHAGQTVCLLGPNGSGKTTLFKSLLGLIPLLSGHIEIHHKPLSQWSRRQLAQTIAYVPQLTTDMFAFKVIDMVLMGRGAYIGWYTAPSKKDTQLALECLEQLGIGHLASKTYTHLSGGERQLVLLARALAQQPRALILDEPTASLDFGNQIKVLHSIQSLKEQGLAIFLCTHQPEHAYRIADEVILLKQGQIISQGATVSVLTVAALANLYDLPLAEVEQHLENVIV